MGASRASSSIRSAVGQVRGHDVPAFCRGRRDHTSPGSTAVPESVVKITTRVHGVSSGGWTATGRRLRRAAPRPRSAPFVQRPGSDRTRRASGLDQAQSRPQERRHDSRAPARGSPAQFERLVVEGQPPVWCQSRVYRRLSRSAEGRDRRRRRAPGRRVSSGCRNPLQRYGRLRSRPNRRRYGVSRESSRACAARRATRRGEAGKLVKGRSPPRTDRHRSLGAETGVVSATATAAESLYGLPDSVVDAADVDGLWVEVLTRWRAFFEQIVDVVGRDDSRTEFDAVGVVVEEGCAFTTYVAFASSEARSTEARAMLAELHSRPVPQPNSRSRRDVAPIRVLPIRADAVLAVLLPQALLSQAWIDCSAETPG